MRFVHIADMHFDAPFTSLNSRENLGEKRRIEQRNAFKKMITYINNNNIKYLFISGDLYEHEYVKRSTIEFISKCFDEIKDTKVFISPGNHDPYVKNSYYYNYDFGENVFVFHNDKLERYEDDEVNIYGMAFNEFYMDESPLEKLVLPYSEKLNILVAHACLNGAKDEDGLTYNSITETKLASIGFDYCAIGHIHKKMLNRKNKIYYPGSTISLGFDELGLHGMLAGEITKDDLFVEFIPLDDRKFDEVDISVSTCSAQEDLIERISTYGFEKKTMYKINLIRK